MIVILTAIRDRAVDAYHPIATVRHEGEAIRGFQDALTNPENKTFYRHPDDYDLYVVGTMDDTTGVITPEGPRKIADGKQLTIGS